MAGMETETSGIGDGLLIGIVSAVSFVTFALVLFCSCYRSSYKHGSRMNRSHMSSRHSSRNSVSASKRHYRSKIPIIRGLSNTEVLTPSQIGADGLSASNGGSSVSWKSRFDSDTDPNAPHLSQASNGGGTPSSTLADTYSNLGSAYPSNINSHYNSQMSGYGPPNSRRNFDSNVNSNLQPSYYSGRPVSHSTSQRGSPNYPRSQGNSPNLSPKRRVYNPSKESKARSPNQRSPKLRSPRHLSNNDQFSPGSKKAGVVPEFDSRMKAKKNAGPSALKQLDSRFGKLDSDLMLNVDLGQANDLEGLPEAKSQTDTKIWLPPGKSQIKRNPN